MTRLLTGLDLGSSNIRAAVCEISKAEKLKLLALDSVPSNGIASGSIVDFDAVRQGVVDIIKRLEKKIKRRIRTVSVALSGSGIKGIEASGMIALAKRPREVTSRDIEKCRKIAGLVQIPVDKQVVQKFTHSFYINEGDKVANPQGLYATKLTLRLYIIMAETAKIKNLYKCVEHAGYLVDDIVFSGCAIAESVLTEEEKKGGIAVIDIGRNLTNIALFEGGVLKFINFLPKGAKDMDDKNFMSSYFQTVKKTLGNSTLPKVIITGGVVLKEDFLENAERKLGIKCELGRVKLNWCPLGPGDALLYTASLGLISYKAKSLASQKREVRLLPNPLKFLNELFDSYF